MSKRSIVKTRARQRGKWVIFVQRTHQHLRVQIINPQRQVVAGVSTLSQYFVEKNVDNKLTSAQKSSILAELVVDLIKQHANRDIGWAFDRGGKAYHGRLKLFCDALRLHGVVV